MTPRIITEGNQPISWGILGTGAIARRFAADLTHVKDAKLLAVGSRRSETARAFGRIFRISRQYGTYEELAEDPDVQAVYVATPASIHKANVELCLVHGKAVLCEKPLTLNAREAEDLIALARSKGTFLMEAMWTRFVPLMFRLRELLAMRAIGDVRCIMADLGSQVMFDPDSRVFSGELGGGALLQKGAYLLSFASMILGAPASVNSLSTSAKSGVDEETGILLGYTGGRMAMLWCSVGVRSGRRGIVIGTQGQIVIHEPIVCPSSLTIRRYAGQGEHHAPGAAATTPGIKGRFLRYAKCSRLIRNLRERFPLLSDRLLYGIRSSTICLPPIGEGLHYQVSEVNRCLRAAKQESEIMPLSESLGIMAAMDRIRNIGGNVP